MTWTWLTPQVIVMITVALWALVLLVILATLIAHVVRVSRADRRERLDAVARPLVAALVLEESDGAATHDALARARGALGDRVDERLLTLLDVVRGEGRDRLVAMLVERGHPDRLRRRARSHRSSTRARAVRQLGQLGLDRDADLLLAATGDRSAIVRSVAARALVAHAGARSVDAILALVREDRSIPALVLMNALVQIGETDPEGLGSIRAGLDDPSARVRASCARVLGELTSAADGDRLAQLVSRDPAPSVRFAAATALTRVGTAAHVPALLEATRTVWAPLRVECVRALQALPPAVSADALADIATRADPVLATVLTQPAPRTEP